jgi:hypothetical protein
MEPPLDYIRKNQEKKIHILLNNNNKIHYPNKNKLHGFT